MNPIIYSLNYSDAPVVREKYEDHLVLESIQNKVWNPLFTAGVVAFILSMTLRGFFDQHFAVIPLGLSTIVLFAGVWKLSAAAIILFDKKESKIHFIYKHLGYLQKTYSHPMSSIETIELAETRNGNLSLKLLKDDGTSVKIAGNGNKKILSETANEISLFMKVPVRE